MYNQICKSNYQYLQKEEYNLASKHPKKASKLASILVL